jgi:hypothetical protein
MGIGFFGGKKKCFFLDAKIGTLKKGLLKIKNKLVF